MNANDMASNPVMVVSVAGFDDWLHTLHLPCDDIGFNVEWENDNGVVIRVTLENIEEE